MSPGSGHTYVSSDLTHFVGRRFNDPNSLHYLESPAREAAEYALLSRILRSGSLTHGAPGLMAYGMGPMDPLSGNEKFSVAATCFCDIPKRGLPVHMGKYGCFGLAFPKVFLVAHGASPVFYIAMNSHGYSTVRNDGSTAVMNRQEYFDAMGAAYSKLRAAMLYRDAEPQFEDRSVRALLSSYPGVLQDPNSAQLKDTVAELSIFLDVFVFGFMKFFEAGLPENHERNYYMEREWRVAYNVPFNPSQVSYLVMPGGVVRTFRSDFPGYERVPVWAAEECSAAPPGTEVGTPPPEPV